MHLVSFRSDRGGLHIGVLDDDRERVLDLTRADLPRDMVDFIALGKPALDRARAFAGDAGRSEWIDLGGVSLAAPIPTPRRNILCVGKNYRNHATEFASSGFDRSDSAAIPDVPIIFTKAPSSVIGPAEPIPIYLDPTESSDYEGELAVVIGKGGRQIDRADAMSHVFGFTIVNDVTARSLQRLHKQWFLGKSIDGYCPMGPAIATLDEVADVSALSLVTEVNGDLRQNAKVADLIFDIPTLIETISRGITLQPGDVIASGTPEGVGIGFEPSRFLKSGDVVRITIDGLGTLENPVA